MADGDQPRELRPREGAGATSRLLEELLAAGRPVAEIAVRLGISIPDAHARIGLTRGGETGGVEPAEPGG
ncbi:MAG: AsnC family protein, partial [Dehalococcoidia bacterium]|nr:AsnC family protein [Dehalococcoidia bacterium]